MIQNVNSMPSLLMYALPFYLSSSLVIIELPFACNNLKLHTVYGCVKYRIQTLDGTRISGGRLRDVNESKKKTKRQLVVPYRYT